MAETFARELWRRTVRLYQPAGCSGAIVERLTAKGDPVLTLYCDGGKRDYVLRSDWFERAGLFEEVLETADSWRP